MAHSRDHTFPIVDHILHPTDFSPESLVAFHHALKAVLLTKGALTLLHDSADEPGGHLDFPGIRETLERWGVLAPDSPRSAVPDLGIEVRKVVTGQANAVKGVLKYLEMNPVDLIVLATHQHEGRAAWRRHAVAQPLARKTGQATLFIPEGCTGFVAAADGAVSLETILIPIAQSPDPQPAIEAAARLAVRLQAPAGRFILLHMGSSQTLPHVDCPPVAGWQWQTLTAEGNVVEGIVRSAGEHRVDVVVMATEGARGFLDALRGSHSERVLVQVPAPLLTVPTGSHAEQSLGFA